MRRVSQWAGVSGCGIFLLCILYVLCENVLFAWSGVSGSACGLGCLGVAFFCFVLYIYSVKIFHVKESSKKRETYDLTFLRQFEKTLFYFQIVIFSFYVFPSLKILFDFGVRL